MPKYTLQSWYSPLDVRSKLIYFLFFRSALLKTPGTVENNFWAMTLRK